MLLQRNSSLVIVIVGPDRNLKILKALFKSQAHQGTSLFTRAATNLSRIRHCLPKCTRGLRVYPYPRIYPFSIRGYGSGTDRVHFSRVGAGTGMGVAGGGVRPFFPSQPPPFF